MKKDEDTPPFVVVVDGKEMELKGCGTCGCIFLSGLREAHQKSHQIVSEALAEARRANAWFTPLA